MPDYRPTVEEELDDRFDPAPFAGADVAVAVPDLTRPVDYRSMLPPIFDRLEAAGPATMSLTVALGLHRPLGEDELGPLREVVEGRPVSLLQHEADGDLVTLEEDVSDGRGGWPELPARYPRHLVDADRLVTVGTVEPHQYAGFSGGAKGIAIGCGSAETVGGMHGLEFLRDPRTQVGRLEGNQFQEALWELLDHLPPTHGLQLVPPVGGAPPRAEWGRVDDAFERATRRAREEFFAPRQSTADWMHLPVPAEKASNFYQASRAATYVALVDRPAIEEGGTLVVEADCPEGVGQGAGERACAEAMRRGREVLLDELESDEEVATRGGQQRAYVLARALDHCDIALVGAPEMEELRAMGISQYDSLDQAREALDLDGDGERVDDVFHAVPVLSGA